MKMHNNRPAPHTAALKIWVAGLILGPVFLFLGTIFSSPDKGVIDSETFLLWGYMVLYGGIFSLPSVGLLWLALMLQRRFRQTPSGFWYTVLGITLVLTAAPFLVLDFFFGEPGYFAGLIAAYLAGIWLGVYWAYRGAKSEQQSLDDSPLDANV